MAVEKVLNLLDKVRSNGKGRWSARCPAHADNGPSLSIREADDGRVLLHCFAGCGAAEVVNALGLSFGDLFPEDRVERRSAGQRLAAADVIDTAHHEILVALAIVSDLRKGIRINEDRLQLCETKLSNCLKGIRPR